MIHPRDKRDKQPEANSKSPLLSLFIGLESGAELSELKRLVELGADPRGLNPKNPESKETPLMKAVARNRVDAVEWLIPLSNVDAQDSEGASALILAVELCRTKAARRLLPVSSASLRTARGDTALSAALRSRHHEIIFDLLPTLIPGQTDRWGDTPLILAVKAGATPLLIDVLVDAGELPARRNAKGQSAIGVAVKTAMEPEALALLSRLDAAEREEALNLALSQCADLRDGHEAARERIRRMGAALNERDALAGCSDVAPGSGRQAPRPRI